MPAVHPETALGVKDKPKYTATLVVLCLTLALGGFLYGYDTGVISGLLSMPEFVYRFGNVDPASTTIYKGQGYSIPSGTQSMITAFLSLGTFFGSLSSGMVADKVGRRNAVFTAIGIFLTGCTIQVSTGFSVTQLIFGRVIAGFGVGMISAIVPLYQSETAPKAIRGALVGGFQLMITVGILVASAVNIGTHERIDSSAWRWPVGLQLLFAAIFGLSMLGLPESPRYLIGSGQDEKAKVVMAKLHGTTVEDPSIDAEFTDLKDLITHENSITSSAKWSDAFKNDQNRMLYRTGIGMAVQAFQQLTGINFYFYYGTKFFQSAGYDDAYIIALILGACNVAATLPGLWLVDRFGRRATLMGGAICMFIGQIIVGTMGTVYPGDTNGPAGKALVAFTCLFIASFAATWGPLAYIVTSETYPTRLRGKCIALAVSSNWIWNLIIAIITPYLTDLEYANLGAKIVFIWAGCIFVSIFWVYFCVPETKGLTLEEVDELYRSNIRPWRTSGWQSSATRRVTATPARLLAERTQD